MFRIEHIDLRDIADLPNPGLTNYLEHLKAGQTDVFRTPLFNKANPQTIVSAWMEEINLANLSTIFPELADTELQQSKKVGPYSVIPPSRKRMSHLKEYWDPVHRDDPVDPMAIKKVKELYKVGDLQLWSLDQVKQKMRLNTSSGLPYFMRRSKAWDIYERKHYKQSPYNRFVAIWGTRVQPGGPSVHDEKVRDVFMMPMLLNMFESQYYYPLLEYEQKHKLPYSINDLRTTEEDITRLFDSKRSEDPVIVTDFTGFDQKFREPLQEAALEPLLYAFSRSAHATIKQTYYEKYRCPLLISQTEIATGPRGMGSGATGTNPDENHAHKALQFEAAITNGEELNPNSRVLGDDGVLCFKGITAKKVTDSYTRHGVEMNPLKQTESATAAKYLQRDYSVSFRDKSGIMLGVYSTFRALGRLLYQERFHKPEDWGPEQVILRSLSIIENCNRHPRFREFVNFIKHGDKYGLGTKIPGFFQSLEKKWEEYKSKFGLESYTQQNESVGIGSWKVVEILWG